MISRQDIKQFINEDQAQIKREIESFRKLTIEEKVKAIIRGEKVD